MLHEPEKGSCNLLKLIPQNNEQKPVEYELVRFECKSCVDIKARDEMHIFMTNTA